ncbi:hypothetical protein [Sorangium cellulosum]|nr:hypothetical protein [Sorangium cellulosum]
MTKLLLKMKIEAGLHGIVAALPSRVRRSLNARSRPPEQPA